MSSIHDRWELVEPLLFGRTLGDPAAFRAGATTRSMTEDLAALSKEHRCEPAAIAQAFALLGEHASPAHHDAEPVHEVICKAADRWLMCQGNHWALRVEARRPGHEIIRWRGVTMLVPPSIIIAGALAGTDRAWPRRVQTLPTSLAPREPVGHLHVHLGPMLPFEDLWYNLWYAFIRRGVLDAPNGAGIAAIKGEDLPEIGRYPSKCQPGLRWQWILELAFAARVWLMAEGPEAPAPAVIRDFSCGKVEPGRRAGALVQLWAEGAWRDRARREARGISEVRLQRERCVSRQRLFADRRATDSTDAGSAVPSDADQEVAFLARCVRRCGTEKDGTYARVFYQYLRVKVALYRLLVVDPWTVGLRHFLDVVQRDGPYSQVIDDGALLDDARIVTAREERPLHVESLEIHVPPTRWLKQPRSAHDRRQAWILSFVRAKRPESGDPDGTRASKRWNEVAAGAGTMCRLLARRMMTHPAVLHEIRALSLMDWERNGPVWLFEASFRRLIEESAKVVAAHPRLRLRPIQTALHLGEDFDHLLSGLRQIFEPFEWGLIQRGDRIGHALALGLSPAAWCEASPWVRMRPWDRILDIGFMYWAFDTLRLSLDAGHVERMRLSAGDAIRGVFGEQGHDPLETARALWLSLPRVPPQGANAFDLAAENGPS